MMSLGIEIRKARFDKGLRQYELAQKVQVSKKYMSEIENDHADPVISIVLRIAAVLGVSMNQLCPITVEGKHAV